MRTLRRLAFAGFGIGGSLAVIGFLCVRCGLAITNFWTNFSGDPSGYQVCCNLRSRLQGYNSLSFGSNHGLRYSARVKYWFASASPAKV